MSKGEKLIEVLIEKVNQLEHFSLEHAPSVCKEIIDVKIVQLQNSMIYNGVFFLMASPIFLASLYYGLDFGYEKNHYSSHTELVYQNTEVVGSLSALFGTISFAILAGAALNALGNYLEIREVDAGHKYFILKELTSMVRK